MEGTMKIKMTLTKSEKILALLNQWDPAGVYKNSGDYRVYNYEAETIAQKVRSNSKAETVEKAIRETMDVVMDGKELDENEVRAMAQFILATVKKK
jgi:hypothetical protein